MFGGSPEALLTLVTEPCWLARGCPGRNSHEEHGTGGHQGRAEEAISQGDSPGEAARPDRPPETRL